MAEEVIEDYVIVVAGSTGYAFANRLSAYGRTKVLLLDVEGDDRPGQFISNPKAKAADEILGGPPVGALAA